VPANACLMVSSSTSLTVSFQEPLSVNAAVVTRYKGTQLSIFSPCSFLERYLGRGDGLRVLCAWFRTGEIVLFVCLFVCLFVFTPFTFEVKIEPHTSL
jgi:hypothetical protein